MTEQCGHTRYIFVVNGETRPAYSSGLRTSLVLDLERYAKQTGKLIDIEQVTCHSLRAELNRLNDTPNKPAGFCPQDECPYEQGSLLPGYDEYIKQLKPHGTF